jgi:extracellular factor (EF) 3-hydroxypalmitic acid methyl ester biosynthesis protein
VLDAHETGTEDDRSKQPEAISAVDGTLPAVTDAASLQNIFDTVCRDFAKTLRQLPRAAKINKAMAYQKVHSFLEFLELIRSTLPPEHEKQLKAVFKQHVLPYTMQSDFCRYCHEKPKGYAGDFMCMEKIWAGRQGLVAEQETVVGRVLTDLTLNSANCKANEYRVHYLSQFLMKFHNARVASVGSGSVIEVRELYKTGSLQETEFHLFDSDPDTFELIGLYCPELLPKLSFYAGNALKTFAQTKSSFELVYSSGLFDYLHLALAKRFISTLWRKVKPGGTLLIINADPHNPTRLWMEYVAEWYMEYKTSEQMLGLAENLEDVKSVTVKQDPFSVYHYLEIVRNAAA